MRTPPRPVGPGTPRPGAPRPAASPRAINLVARVTSILFQPTRQWPEIETEFSHTATLYKGYIAPLAAIGPVCTAVWLLRFTHASVSAVVTTAIASYVLAIIAVTAIAFVINVLAPTFGGQANTVQALKVAAYASTAWWVGGVFQLVPTLGVLSIVPGLYSFYLLYTGLPVVMKASTDRAVSYTVTVIVGALVIWLITGAIAAAFWPSRL